MTNKKIIEKAATVIKARKWGDSLVGNVGCALLTDQNNIYTGVCIDTASGTGFCAEAAAIGTMATAGEAKIKKIVAVKQEGNVLYVLSPCGRCRLFIAQADTTNLETEVVLSEEMSIPLKDLLPYHNWSQKVV
jgi:cytidine deaminase